MQLLILLKQKDIKSEVTELIEYLLEKSRFDDRDYQMNISEKIVLGTRTYTSATKDGEKSIVSGQKII